MADKQLWEVTPVATDVKNDDGVIIGGQTAGTRYAPLTLIANYVHNLWASFINAITPLKTSFASGDKFPIVNGSTATAMSKDTLLELTSQNTIAVNVAPSFDETGDTDYLAGTTISRNGKTYILKANHSGSWDDSDVEQIDLATLLLNYLEKNGWGTAPSYLLKGFSGGNLLDYIDVSFEGYYIHSVVDGKIKLSANADYNTYKVRIPKGYVGNIASPEFRFVCFTDEFDQPTEGGIVSNTIYDPTARNVSTLSSGKSAYLYITLGSSYDIANYIISLGNYQTKDVFVPNTWRKETLGNDIVYNTLSAETIKGFSGGNLLNHIVETHEGYYIYGFVNGKLRLGTNLDYNTYKVRIPAGYKGNVISNQFRFACFTDDGDIDSENGITSIVSYETRFLSTYTLSSGKTRYMYVTLGSQYDITDLRISLGNSLSSFYDVPPDWRFFSDGDTIKNQSVSFMNLKGFSGGNLVDYIDKVFEAVYVNQNSGKIFLSTNADYNTYRITLPKGFVGKITSTSLRFAAFVKGDEITLGQSGSVYSNFTTATLTDDGTRYLYFSVKTTEDSLSNKVISVGNSTTKEIFMPENWHIPQKSAKMEHLSAKESSLASGESVTTDTINVTKGVHITAHIKGSITDSVCVGVSYLGYYGIWLEIDGTNITPKMGETPTALTPIAHGLTLDGDLTVIIDKVDAENKVSVSLYNGTKSSFKTEVTWETKYGEAFILNNNQSGTLDVEISMFPKDLNKDIWIFADSYGGMYVTDRWPYYLVNAGHTSWLMNARGGENATQALADFNTLLSISNGPKIALWCMGMNQGNDTEDGPNATWLEKTQSFISTCEANGIEPVLMTIPSCPNYVHEKMNAWIRSSGYRYVDADAAVSNGVDYTWKYSGTAQAFLSVDNVHPSIRGARAIYNQVILDLPEVTME